MGVVILWGKPNLLEEYMEVMVRSLKCEGFATAAGEEGLSGADNIVSEVVSYDTHQVWHSSAKEIVCPSARWSVFDLYVYGSARGLARMKGRKVEGRAPSFASQAQC